ncbi:hypothetical protein D3C72_967270 [compost metagenome]
MHADIARVVDQIMRQRTLENSLPPGFSRAADDDVGEIIGIGVGDDLTGQVQCRQGHRLAAKLLREPHGARQPVFFRLR